MFLATSRACDPPPHVQPRCGNESCGGSADHPLGRRESNLVLGLSCIRRLLRPANQCVKFDRHVECRWFRYRPKPTTTSMSIAADERGRTTPCPGVTLDGAASSMKWQVCARPRTLDPSGLSVAPEPPAHTSHYSSAFIRSFPSRLRHAVVIRLRQHAMQFRAQGIDHLPLAVETADLSGQALARGNVHRAHDALDERYL